MTYGDIWGSEALRSGISKLYHTIKADEVVLTHGAAGANHHVFCSLISAGDRVVSIMPTYQQLYSIPEAIGADVAIMHLKQENDYLPDLNELKSLVTHWTEVVCDLSKKLLIKSSIIWSAFEGLNHNLGSRL